MQIQYCDKYQIYVHKQSYPAMILEYVPACTDTAASNDSIQHKIRKYRILRTTRSILNTYIYQKLIMHLVSKGA